MKLQFCGSRAALACASTTLFVSSIISPASIARAQAVDAAGDFLSTYTAGARNGDLDVLTADVVFNGSSFVLTSTFADTIGTTPGALYVWGFDRGAGTARFSPALVGTENIKFDAAITLRPDTTATIARIGGTTTNLAAGAVTISGNRMTATIAASELPTTGFALDRYTFNLWPRLGAGNNNQISDFAPNNSNIQVQAAPEPSTLSLVGFGIIATFGVVRRTRNRRREQI